MITQQELKQYLHYDPQTGIWKWRKGRRAGKRAGGLTNNSRGHRYWNIGFGGRRYTASHLAYFYMIGEWPVEEMDHINRIAADDRWENLRSVTRSENEWNKEKYRNNKSGAKGIYLQHGKWVARIRRNGIRRTIGNFETVQEAATAYQKEAAL
jgi:hypothetical protein